MNPSKYPSEDVEVLIEIRGIYDGWSVAKMKDGNYINRWEPEDRRWTATQNWIDRQAASASGGECGR